MSEFSHLVRALPDHPKCFDSREQYDAWRHFLDDRTAKDYCQDCTPEYQAEMIRQYRCENPHAIFIEEINNLGELEVVKHGRTNYGA